MVPTTATATTAATTTTLYERLGGDTTMNLMVWSFYDELIENEELAPFFQNTALTALKTHLVKLFKVMCGSSEEQPEQEALLEYMLQTHTRLFRENGLSEHHFDILANCFVQCLKTFQLEQSLIDEFTSKLIPLRVVFEYGAQLAQQEKEMTPEQLEELPQANANTIGTDELVTLPMIHYIDIPDWLPKVLQGGHKNANDETVVRRWTCELIDRFGIEGDKEIADTFLDQPYLDHHIYCVALLQLAFLPEEEQQQHANHRKNMLDIVLFPRGEDCAPLSRHLFDKMIVQFVLACNKFGMDKLTS